MTKSYDNFNEKNEKELRRNSHAIRIGTKPRDVCFTDAAGPQVLGKINHQSVFIDLMHVSIRKLSNKERYY
ncbi:hypothetical protein ACROYT_G023550 [Oculina patagonica]